MRKEKIVTVKKGFTLMKQNKHVYWIVTGLVKTVLLLKCVLAVEEIGI
jgi:hypothetical protein